MTAIEKAIAAVTEFAIDNNKKNIDRWQAISYSPLANVTVNPEDIRRTAAKNIVAATHRINKLGG